MCGAARFYTRPTANFVDRYGDGDIVGIASIGNRCGERPVIGGDRVAVTRGCLGTADGPEFGLSRYRGYDLTYFVARGNVRNDALLQKK